MVQYIYFVKCPNCEDEPFDFFDDAKGYALGCMSSKPIITQVEVCRNDFGECTDSTDHGTVWSWEDMMTDVPMDDELSTFSKGETLDFDYDPDQDPEFLSMDNTLDEVPDNFRKPISENAIQNGGFRTDGYRTALACYDSDDFDINVEFGLQDEDEYEVEDQLYLLCPGQTVADLVVYLSRKCGFTNIYVYGETSATRGEMKTATRFETEPGTHDYRQYGNIEDRLVEKCNKKDRKPIPEGMTLEELVEEMEENEDEVECRRCNDLYDKSDCRYEVDMGWLCDHCISAIKSRGETLTFREGPLDEELTFRPKETVEFHYDKITVPIVTEVIPATHWEPEDYYEKDYTGEFDYEVPAADVAVAIYENFLTEEDVADFKGGFDALEDEKAWLMYLETHFDSLVEKYYDQLLKYYEDDATEAAQEKFQDDYDNYNPEPDYESDYFDAF